MVNASLPISFHTGNHIFLSRKSMGNFAETLVFLSEEYMLAFTELY